MTFCRCGCGEEIREGRKYKSGHNSRIDHPNKLPFHPIPTLCLCGCNEVVWNGRQYINNHHVRGKNNPMKREDIKDKLRIKNIGNLNPNWKDGNSYKPYCIRFNYFLKERIRKRDSRTCQLCGCMENSHKLHTHHIHRDKENCYPDLISLCRICHLKVSNVNDYTFYEYLFMNNLNSRELLLWR